VDLGDDFARWELSAEGTSDATIEHSRAPGVKGYKIKISKAACESIFSGIYDTSNRHSQYVIIKLQKLF